MAFVQFRTKITETTIGGDPLAPEIDEVWRRPDNPIEWHRIVPVERDREAMNSESRGDHGCDPEEKSVEGPAIG